MVNAKAQSAPNTPKDGKRKGAKRAEHAQVLELFVYHACTQSQKPLRLCVKNLCVFALKTSASLR
ncbi:MAG: hypothetical protein D6687_00075 [Acidobacteria bacterium]|jgi:hypothetical protein|nr:MAG: hypothetical protein D6687_00075 [Acidobacteriota bacterium]